MEPRFTVIKKRPKVVTPFGRWGVVGVESPKVVEFDHLGALSQNMDQPHGCLGVWGLLGGLWLVYLYP